MNQDLSILNLVLNASWVVQAVMALLLSNGQTGPHRNCEHPHARND